MKKILSLVLVCIMLLGTLPSVYAADTSNRPSPESMIKYGNIIMKLGEPYAYARGELENMPAPYKSDGVVYLPIDAIAPFLNTRFEWNSKKNTGTWLYYVHEYIFTPGKDTFVKFDPLDDSAVEYPLGGTAVRDEKGTVWVPLAAVAEVADLRYAELENGVILFHTKEAKYEAENFTQADKDMVAAMFSENHEADKIQKIFYVDPQKGRDAYDGSLKYPFRNLAYAKEAVKEYKQQKGQTGDIVIYLRGGEYNFSEPLNFDESDSGLNGYKVIWAAYPGEEVIMNGGVPVKSWEKSGENTYRAFVGGGKAVSTFFEGESFGVLARYPNKGYNTVIAAKNGANKGEFIFKDGDIPFLENPATLTWSGWPGGESGEFNWFHENTPITGIDYDTNTVYMANSRLGYALGTGSRYFVEGAKELLDAPGEFWYDSSGWLYYIPIAEDITKASCILPIESVMKIIGSDGEHIVENIRFEGIKFRNSARSLVNTYNCANIQFDGCEFRNAGESGVAISGFVEEFRRMVGVRIENCGIFNMGQNGVVGETRPWPDDNMSKYHVIKNNRVDNVGIRVRSSTGIIFFGVGYMQIAYNSVSRSGRFGIRAAGPGPEISYFSKSPFDPADIEAADLDWIQEHNSACNNIFEYNDLFLTMDDSQDGGALYTFGMGYNNIMRNNSLYDNTAYFSYLFPLYADGNSNNMNMYNNIVYRNQSVLETEGRMMGAICVNVGTHKARVFNNIMAGNPADGGSMEGMFYHAPQAFTPFRSDQASFAKNIGYMSGTSIFPAAGKPTDELNLKYHDYNLWYDGEGETFTTFGAYDEKGMLTAFDNSWEQHSIFGSDPQFMNPDDYDYRMRYTSPAFRLGYRDMDKKTGINDNYKLKDGDEIYNMFVEIEDCDSDGFASLKSGEETQLSTIIEDKEAYVVKDAAITYTSDKPEIATVDEAGKVKAISKGVAEITITATKGDISKTRIVHILVDDEIKELRADTALGLILPGEKSTARAWFVTEFGRQMKADNLEFASENEGVLKVDEKGLFEGVSAGKTNVIVTDKATGLTAKTSVEVKDGLFKEFSVDVSSSLLQVGQNVTAKLAFEDEKGNPIEVPIECVAAESSEPDVLEVAKKSASEIELIPKESGTTSVKFVVNADGTKRTAHKNIYVLSGNDKIDTEWKFSNYGEWELETGNIPTDGEFTAYSSGVFNLRTNGNDFWGKSDKGTFGYKKLQLDPNNPVAEVILTFEQSPKEMDIPGVGRNLSYTGVMIRSGDTADARDMHFRWGCDQRTILAYRTEIGGGSFWMTGSTFTNPPQMRLIYDGGTVKMYYRSNEDDPWTMFKSMSFVADNNEICLGVATFSGNRDANGVPMYTEALGSVKINVGKDVDQSDLSYEAHNAQ